MELLPQHPHQLLLLWFIIITAPVSCTSAYTNTSTNPNSKYRLPADLQNKFQNPTTPKWNKLIHKGASNNPPTLESLIKIHNVSFNNPPTQNVTESEKLFDVTLLTSYEHKIFPKSSFPLMSLSFFSLFFSQLALVACLIIHLVTIG